MIHFTANAVLTGADQKRSEKWCQTHFYLYLGLVKLGMFFIHFYLTVFEFYSKGKKSSAIRGCK